MLKRVCVCVCFRELLSHHSENLRTLMTHTVLNELSSSRNPNNMTLIAIMFQHAPDKSAKVSVGVRGHRPVLGDLSLLTDWLYWLDILSQCCDGCYYIVLKRNLKYLALLGSIGISHSVASSSFQCHSSYI